MRNHLIKNIGVLISIEGHNIHMASGGLASGALTSTIVGPSDIAIEAKYIKCPVWHN